jgi:predicted dehydrogenase
VKVYNKGVDVRDREQVYETLVQYRIGDMYAPKIDQTEALSLMAAEFVECIRSGKKPTASGQSGLNIVRLLDAADRSMKTGGRMVKL